MSRRDLAELIREERAEVARMDEINDLIALDEERAQADPDDIEETERFLERFWRE